MKTYNVFLHISSANGVFNDTYRVSAQNAEEAGPAAVRRVVDELDRVTEVSVISVTEEGKVIK